MKQKKISFLHTADSHVGFFEGLLRPHFPQLMMTHAVATDLLAKARQEGVTAGLEERVAQQLVRLAAASPDVIICTCSTLGAVAEAAGPRLGIPVMRVDRPLAAEAVQIGGRVGVLVTLESTIGPTRDLLLAEAAHAQQEIVLIEQLCDGAWSYFEAGDMAGYHKQVAASIQAIAPVCDVVVLAQASMAGALAFLADEIGCPVLSSPAALLRYVQAD